VIEYLENDPFAGSGGRRPRWISGILGGGRPSRYSRSPALWNGLFGRLGLDAAFLAFDLARAEDLPAFIQAFIEQPGALDLTVTNPYKAAAWDALPHLGLAPGLKPAASERVTSLGCLNHLIVDRAGGRLLAENTDGIGMLRALEDAAGRLWPAADPRGRPSVLAGRRALLVGAGGAAASIGLELARAGAELTVANIIEADAQALAERLGGRAGGAPIEAGGWELIARAAPAAELIVSAITSGTPLEAPAIADLDRRVLLADVRYGASAEFVRACQAAGRSPGLDVVDGEAMLYRQFAAAAWLALSSLGLPAERLDSGLEAVRRNFLKDRR
jgi:shikimate dehydrogenase